MKNTMVARAKRAIISSIRTVFLAILILLLVIRLAKQELPTPNFDTACKAQTWDTETKKWLSVLASCYATQYIEKYPEKGIPCDTLKYLFFSFLESKAPTIQVRMLTDDYAENGGLHGYFFGLITKNAIYASGVYNTFSRTIYIVPDTTKCGGYTGSFLDHFFGELAHHINEDHKLGRMLAYVDDVLTHAVDIGKLYNSQHTSEFQAHEITERAIEYYLFQNATNIPWPSVYAQTYEAVYRLLASANIGSRNNQYLSKQISTKLSPGFEQMQKQIDIQCKNLELLHHTIDSLPLEGRHKTLTFQYCIEHSNAIFYLEHANAKLRLLAHHPTLWGVCRVHSEKFSERVKIETLADYLRTTDIEGHQVFESMVRSEELFMVQFSPTEIAFSEQHLIIRNLYYESMERIVIAGKMEPDLAIWILNWYSGVIRDYHWSKQSYPDSQDYLETITAEWKIVQHLIAKLEYLEKTNQIKPQ